MTKSLLKTIIVDDHEMFRNGLKLLLEKNNIAQTIGEASNGVEFLQMIGTLSPDLVLMDIDMPEMDGISASEKALAQNRNLNILVLSMHDDYTHYSSLVSAGVKGFISKSSGKTELEKGIAAVGNGDYYFSTALLRNLFLEINKPKENIDRHPDDSLKFTPREQDVLKFICNGFASNEIADKLCLTTKSVDNLRSKLLQKTGARNSVGLVMYAIRNKIITL